MLHLQLWRADVFQSSDFSDVGKVMSVSMNSLVKDVYTIPNIPLLAASGATSVIKHINIPTAKITNWHTAWDK